MSSKLIKDSRTIALPGDDEIMVQITITKAGSIKVNAPYTPPGELVKLLNNLATDITFTAIQQSMEKKEESKLALV